MNLIFAFDDRNSVDIKVLYDKFLKESEIDERESIAQFYTIKTLFYPVSESEGNA